MARNDIGIVMVNVNSESMIKGQRKCSGFFLS